ncbi:MAG: winged helix-turn-helix transcriptional regulator [Alphaproteobacteria bacterium]|nr:winged helix-turn-helix transcriptional regulator [Alphaproteobacteria bacterium]
MTVSTADLKPPAQIAQDLPRLIERMHRRYLDVVRIELARRGTHDISPVQAMMLGTIGHEEISVRDLIERGYYLGSNASYNLKNLVDCGYVQRQASARDRRSARLKLSAKGRDILAALAKLNVDMADGIIKGESENRDLDIAHATLRRLERRWTDAIRAESHGDDADF